MADPPIKLKLLGVFGLIIDGVEVQSVPRPAQELLLHLVMAGARGIDRGQTSSAIWPYADSGRAQFYLRRTLMQARSALGMQRARLQAPDDRRIVLDLAGCNCDLLLFEAGLHESDPARIASAVRAYEGGLLLGHGSEGVRHARERYRDLYISMLKRLTALARQAGEMSAALEWATLAREADPLREDTCRDLMAVLHDGDDLAGIARAYRDLKLAMRRGIGLTPSQETTELYRKLLADARLSASGRPEAEASNGISPSGLPTPVSEFIGRRAECAILAERVQQSRLVTLMGMGGVGKSRLAIQCAREVAGQFPGGVAFASMSICIDSAEVADRIACALGIPDSGDLTRFSPKGPGRSLLVLDGVEQVAGACAEVLAELLRSCPLLHVLCTSRVALQSPDELLMSLDPMAVPAPGSSMETARSAEAVSLFLSLAARAAPTFVADGENLTAVFELCRRLDGLPLALELAAVRLRTLPIRDVLTHLDDRFRLLNTAHGGVPHGRTLEGVLAWSFKLLSAREQKLFERLGVFPSTWTVADAQAVCAEGSLGASEIPAALAALVDHSLVLFERGRFGGFYRMLETVRSYARLRLERDPDAFARVRARQAEHYLAVATRSAGTVPEPRRLLADQANFAVAVDHFLACKGRDEREKALLLVNRLLPHLYRCGAVSEGLRLALHAAESFGDSTCDALAETLFRAAGAAHWLYKIDLADELYTKAEEMAVALGYTTWSAESLRDRGELAANEARLERAESLLKAAIELFRASQDLLGEASCLGTLGYVRRQQREYDLAVELTEEALAIHTRIDNTEGRLWCMGSLAATFSASGRPEKAAEILVDTLAHQEKEGNLPAQVWNLTMLGVTHVQLGDLAAAENYLVRALAVPGIDAEDGRKTWATLELGDLLRRTGRLEQAESLLLEVLAKSRKLGSVVTQAQTLLRLCQVSYERGNEYGARAYRSAAAELIATIEASELREQLRELDEGLFRDPHTK
jgi:predicted ATPase/DNA-binding SARP family transcriptional activator